MPRKRDNHTQKEINKLKIFLDSSDAHGVPDLATPRIKKHAASLV